MKFIINQDHLYSYRRLIRKFALLPIFIDGEIRWLETVYIEQAYSVGWGNWYNENFATQKQWEQWEQDKAQIIAGRSTNGDD
jgi:hypothetical protein